MSKVTVDMKLTKEHEGVKTSKGGVKFLSLKSLVEDTQDGPKWYNGVVFGGFADVAAAALKKGMELRVEGQVVVKEYTKRDGGVGLDNTITISKITLEGGKVLDKFLAPAAEVKNEEAPF